MKFHLFQPEVVNINCEMCGKDDVLFKASIEGTMMNVCKNCSRFGKVISQIYQPQPAKKQHQSAKQSIQTSQKERIQVIVEDFSSRIKNARELRNLTQKDFAKMLNEKESLVHQLETGHHTPNIELARKLEKFLDIKLVEETEEEPLAAKQGKSETFTIGDFIKVRKR